MMSKCLTHPKILHLQPLRWMSMRPRTPTAGRQQVYIARGHWRGMGGRPARLAEPDEDRGAFLVFAAAGRRLSGPADTRR